VFFFFTERLRTRNSVVRGGRLGKTLSGVRGENPGKENPFQRGQPGLGTGYLSRRNPDYITLAHPLAPVCTPEDSARLAEHSPHTIALGGSIRFTLNGRTITLSHTPRPKSRLAKRAGRTCSVITLHAMRKIVGKRPTYAELTGKEIKQKCLPNPSRTALVVLSGARRNGLEII
jgi:hypothetical protein